MRKTPVELTFTVDFSDADRAFNEKIREYENRVVRLKSSMGSPAQSSASETATFGSPGLPPAGSAMDPTQGAANYIQMGNQQLQTAMIAKAMAAGPMMGGSGMPPQPTPAQLNPAGTWTNNTWGVGSPMTWQQGGGMYANYGGGPTGGGGGGGGGGPGGSHGGGRPATPGGFFEGMTANRMFWVASSAYSVLKTVDDYSTQGMKSREMLRYDSTVENAQQNYDEARNTNYLKRWGGDIGNQVLDTLPNAWWLKPFGVKRSKYSFNDSNTVEQAYDTLNQATAQAQEASVLRGARGIKRATESIGYKGIAGEIAALENEKSKYEEDYQEQIRNRKNGSYGDIIQNRDARRAMTAAQIAVAHRDYGNQLKYQEGMNQADASRAAFRGYGAAQLEITAQMRREMDELNLSRGKGQMTDEEYGRAKSVIEERAQNAGDALKNKSNAEATNLIRENEASSANMRLSRQGQGLAGRLGVITAAEQNEISAINLDQSDPNYAKQKVAIQQRSKEQRTQAVYEQGMDALMTGKGLDASSRTMDQMLQRNYVGAQASSITGDTEQSVLGFLQLGQFKNAEKAKSNGLKRIDLAEQDYTWSFRAQQEDLQNNSIMNPRDVQNPNAAFKELDKARSDIGGMGTKAEDADKLSKEALREAMEQAIAGGKLRAEVKAAIDESGNE